LRAGVFQRAATFERAELEETGKLPLSFASEAPANQYYPEFGFVEEVLDHSDGSVRLDRLNTGGSVISAGETHAGKLVGKVDRAWLQDRKSHADVQISTRTAAGQEELALISEGIRQNVSARYKVHKVMIEERDAGGRVTKVRAVDWEPYHIAFVDDPADVTVGISRSDAAEYDMAVEDTTAEPGEVEEVEIHQDRSEMKDRNTPASGDPQEPTVHTVSVQDRDAAVAEAGQVQKDRAARIMKIGERFNQSITDIKDAIDSDKSPEGYLDAMLSAQTPGQALSQGGGEVGLSRSEVEEYSFFKLLNYLSDPSDKKARERAALELEASDFLADKMGVDPKGAFVPREIQVMENRNAVDPRLFPKMKHFGIVAQQLAAQRQADAMMGRALDTGAGAGTDASAVVPTELLSGSFIDALRAATPLLNEATVLDNLQGDIDIPRRSAASDPDWVATEGADTTESDGAFDTVQLRPNDVGAWIQSSRRLFLQSSIALENFLRQDLALGIGIKAAFGAIQGTGASGAPTGYLNTAGIGDVTSGGAPDWADIVELWTDVAGANALGSRMAFHAPAVNIGTLLTTPKETGFPQYLADSTTQMLGNRIILDNQVPTDTVAFLDFAQILLAFWGTLDIFVERVSKSGNVIITAMQTMDVALRQESAVSAIQDIT